MGGGRKVGIEDSRRHGPCGINFRVSFVRDFPPNLCIRTSYVIAVKEKSHIQPFGFGASQWAITELLRSCCCFTLVHETTPTYYNFQNEAVSDITTNAGIACSPSAKQRHLCLFTSLSSSSSMHIFPHEILQLSPNQKGGLLDTTIYLGM